MLYDQHLAMNRDPNTPAPLTEDEVAELKALMAEEQARDRAK